MASVSHNERSWLQLVALGPFSFRFEGDTYTTTREVTVCASTYNAMMRAGWVEEVI